MQHEPAQHGQARPRVHRDGDRCAVAAATGTELRLPSWTTMRYKVNLETKVGLGFFGEVYRGAWRGNTIASKVLARVDTAPDFRERSQNTEVPLPPEYDRAIRRVQCER